MDDSKQLINELKKQIAELIIENSCLKEQNKKYQKSNSPSIENLSKPSVSEPENKTQTGTFQKEEKIKIFKDLFCSRDDLYAVRWEARNARTGYSPACENEWKPALCGKPKTKCADCKNRKFIPLADDVVYNHLSGKHIIGVYPLLPDETCKFLIIDFDKSAWKEDVRTFLDVCAGLEIPAVLERSRSGNGGHIWIFFEERVPASQARKLGSFVLTRAMEKRHQIGFDSYDRFFPSQDTMPKGGFGNLIALPLQRLPRGKGNSVFINSDYEPYADQWAFLSAVKRMSLARVNSIVDNALQSGGIIDVKLSMTDSDTDNDPWTLPPSKIRKEKPINDPLPACVRIVHSNMIFIEKRDLPPAMLNRLLRIAAFQNPEFYKAQAMRLSTFGKPRIIACGEEYPNFIGLPRGSMDEALQMFKMHNVDVKIEDMRCGGAPINANFQGNLRPLQEEVVRNILKNDIGILSAGTAFGKTVVAASMISKRNVNTLVLVHRRQLLDQWIERLSQFLDMPKESIGQIGGGKNVRTGNIDVGIIQSLYRKGAVKDFVAEYGHVIVDECHHVSAFSFEQVMKQVKAKYVLGLTATPIRKDGHHPIIIMQCGPIVFRISEKEQKMPFDHTVIPRSTDFVLTEDQATDASIQDIYGALIHDEKRNELILQDVLKSLKAGRFPLLLTERTEHLEYFRRHLEGSVKNIFLFKGGMGVKQRRELYNKLASVSDNEERIIISTGRYIGEGFDNARLDTLFLVMPVSWRGTIRQYVGRLHRLHDSKKEVLVYDYVDSNVLKLKRMFNRRINGYKAVGYSIDFTTSENEAALPLGK
jgi:superfamily II DNA or RNA helicase